MPCARAAVRSCVRPGVARENHSDAVGGDECAVDDDEVAFAQPDEGLVQAWHPGGQDFECLVDLAPGRRLRHPEPGTDLCERLVLPQMGQRQQRLLEAAQLPPARAKFTPSGVDEPGDMLDQLVNEAPRPSAY